MGKVGSADAKLQVTLKPQAQAKAKEAAPISEPASKPGLSEKTKKKAGLQTSFTSTQATFKPGPAPSAGPDVVLRDLGSPKERAALASVPQTNSIAKQLGNENDICAAASLVSALVLQSGTDAAARANAAALGSNFDRAKYVSNDLRAHVETALSHLADRTMSKEDVAYLQQAAYAIGRNTGQSNETPGLSTEALAAMVADLKGAGATLGPGTSFAQVFDGQNGHWVAMQGKTFINTANEGEAGKRKWAEAQPGATEFSAQVRFTAKGELQVQTRYRGPEMSAADSGWQATITPSDSRNAMQRSLQGNFRQIVDGLLAATEGKLAH